MSLTTDEIFYKALTADKQLTEAVGGRIRSTCFEVPWGEKDNTPTPYILVIFEGLNNDGLTKDNDYEGETDNVSVSIEVAAESRKDVGRIAKMVRRAVFDYIYNMDEDCEDYDNRPSSYQMSASAALWDDSKPAYFQILTYQCETKSDIEF